MATLMGQTPLHLRTGDLIEVRSKEEILATLDHRGRLENLPFMPEMLQFCGRRFRVAAVAHKTCDPAHRTGGRRMKNAVHLQDLRCDGSAHGGCQASCLLFWKTAWLKRVDGPHEHLPNTVQHVTEEQLIAATQLQDERRDRPIYSCQATCLFDATTPLRWWNPLQYVRDLTSRNVTPGHAAKVLLLAIVRAWMGVGIGYRFARRFYEWLHVRLMGWPAPKNGGTIPRGAPTPRVDVGLQPGELVNVRTNTAILETLNSDNKNRGMWFDEEMVPYCGGTYRVKARIDRIINEVTGEMMQMKSPCITLEDVTCRALYAQHRLFCPRAITPYWREIWLERASGASENQ